LPNGNRFTGNLIVNGNLYHQKGSTRGYTDDFSVTIGAKWISATARGNSLIPNIEELIFNGTGDQLITRNGDDLQEDFYNPAIDKTSWT
jgi:hypothetical protein